MDHEELRKLRRKRAQALAFVGVLIAWQAAGLLRGPTTTLDWALPLGIVGVFAMLFALAFLANTYSFGRATREARAFPGVTWAFPVVDVTCPRWILVLTADSEGLHLWRRRRGKLLEGPTFPWAHLQITSDTVITGYTAWNAMALATAAGQIALSPVSLPCRGQVASPGLRDATLKEITALRAKYQLQ